MSEERAPYNAGKKDIKIKMVEWFDDHWYQVILENKEIRWIPSVTTKLGITDKPFLARWRGDIGNREADMRVFEAQQRGSRIHAAFDVLQRGGTIIYQPWQRPNFTPQELEEIKKKNPSFVIVQYQDEMFDLVKLQTFLKKVKPQIVSTELTVYSLDDNDAGTVDALYKIEEGDYQINGSKPMHLAGGLYVADLKTGSMVDKNAYCQTAAYLNCIKKMGLAKPIGTLILHTQSKNKSAIEGFGVHVRMGDDLREDYRKYRLISDLWMADHNNDTPKVFEFPTLLTMDATDETK